MKTKPDFARERKRGSAWHIGEYVQDRCTLSEITITTTTNCTDVPCEWFFACQGMRERPSGRFPSERLRPCGSIETGMSADAMARTTRSFKAWRRAGLPGAFLQTRPWRPIASTKAPQWYWLRSNICCKLRTSLSFDYHSSIAAACLCIGPLGRVGRRVVRITATLKDRASVTRSRHSLESCWWPRHIAARAWPVRAGADKMSPSASHAPRKPTQNYRFTLPVSASYRQLFTTHATAQNSIYLN